MPGTGKVGRNLEVDDDRLRFIASDELNSAKARILLMLALLKKRTLAEIQQLFYDYYLNFARKSHIQRSKLEFHD